MSEAVRRKMRGGAGQMKVASLTTVASLALSSAAHAGPRDVPITPPVCETVIVKEVSHGCKKEDALEDMDVSPGDAWVCPGAGSSSATARPRTPNTQIIQRWRHLSRATASLHGVQDERLPAWR
jgi:hypothetical protein